MKELSKRVNAKSVMLSNENHARLEKMGKFGETYNDVITRLIKEYENLSRVAHEYDRLRSQIVGLCVCQQCDHRWFIDDVRNLGMTVKCPECGSAWDSLVQYGQ